MARNNYSGDKRRRELNKKKKKEQKRRERADRSTYGTDDTAGDSSYLEYLNPGGPQDGRFIEEEEESDEEDASEEDEETR
ncbi:MAG: hypothetical protein WCY01_14385 [Alkalispirochaeta sp.]